ncbi:hypothetical protein [Actinokineospora sp.]|uniref:hypothetical protein n=1 Tax=Actinokineospora sp. TaxID=1872133 RepID=UPI003D6B41AC
MRRVDPGVMPEVLKGFALILATFADPDGTRVRPGIPSLRAITGKSPRTVQDRLTDLHERLGFLILVRRGGGRGGSGRVNEYRLAIPADLLERVGLIGIDEQSPATAVAAQSAEPLATATAAQSQAHPVDKPLSPATATADENDFHRQPDDNSDRLTGNPAPIDRQQLLPTTRTGPTTKRDHSGCSDPTQPPEAGSQADNGNPSPVEAIKPRAKCPHGLAPRASPDGKPSCPLCRRALPSTKDT